MFQFRLAETADRERIFSLYQAAIGTEGCTWDDTYPSREMMDDDLSRGGLFCAERDGILVGAISIDDDPYTDALDVWDEALMPAAELARVVVSEECRGEGIAPRMFREMHGILRERGYRSAHYLVSPENQKALHAYETLGYRFVGTADLYEHHWLCYEMRLDPAVPSGL